MNQQRKLYDFKSVGELETSRNQRLRNQNENRLIGIKTPLERGNNSFVAMHTSIVNQIRDNFRNLIMTNHGERMMLTNYGANLLPLSLELGTENIDIEAQRRIFKAAQDYMPYIQLETFEPLRYESNTGDLIKVGVRVGYSIASLGVTNQMIEAIIYAGA